MGFFKRGDLRFDKLNSLLYNSCPLTCKLNRLREVNMSVSWLKKGNESVSIAKQDAASTEKRRSERGRMFRFFLKNKEECRITFIDGDLGPEGFLVPPRYYEHNLFMNGRYNNFFVCPEKTNPNTEDPCPICAGGDWPSLVALFTIIDHRSFKTKDNVLVPYSTKLFVAKSGTFELLNKLAGKKGGLAGASFDVSRIGDDKVPAVGNMFDFVEKKTPQELQGVYTRQMKDEKGVLKLVDIFKPAEYEKEINYISSKKLLEMGFGSQVFKAPSNVNVNSQTSEEAPADFEQHL